MPVADENGIEFLDLKLKIVEGKINVNVHSKPTNSFTYELPSATLMKSIIKVPVNIKIIL